MFAKSKVQSNSRMGLNDSKIGGPSNRGEMTGYHCSYGQLDQGQNIVEGEREREYELLTLNTFVIMLKKRY